MVSLCSPPLYFSLSSSCFYPLSLFLPSPAKESNQNKPVTLKSNNPIEVSATYL